VYVTVAQQQHNLKYLALYVRILGDGLRAFLLRYQIFKYARASECMHAGSMEKLFAKRPLRIFLKQNLSSAIRITNPILVTL